MDGDTDSESNEGLFYFESDHLFLRHSSQYSDILRTIVLLESQRIAVHKQIEELVAAKQRYIQDKELFLHDLKNNQIYSPPLLNIAMLPDMKVKTEGVEQSIFEDIPTSDMYKRASDTSRNNKYSRYWTAEEQKRLEDLLMKYPEERVDMHRFAKIAKELGSRTPLQVCSRVQKYFLKLCSAGLPIPGRTPKNRRYISSKSKFSFKPSSFFPIYNVPVKIRADDKDFLFSSARKITAMDFDNLPPTSAIDIKTEPVASHETSQQMISILQTIRKEKQSAAQAGNNAINPTSPKCVMCITRPISNTYWYCQTCSVYLNICNDCLVTQLIDGSFSHFEHTVIVASDKCFQLANKKDT